MIRFCFLFLPYGGPLRDTPNRTCNADRCPNVSKRVNQQAITDNELLQPVEDGIIEVPYVISNKEGPESEDYPDSDIK